MNFPMQSPEVPARDAEVAFMGGSNFVLPQRGRRPLAFVGTEIAMATSFTPAIPYWYEINIYRSRDDQFIVAIRKFFQSEAIDDVVEAWTFPSIEHVFFHIEGYDPATDIPVPSQSFDSMAPAELSAVAMQTMAQIEEARTHFSGLVGEILYEIDSSDQGLAA